MWFDLPDAFTRIPSPPDEADETDEWAHFLDEVLPPGEAAWDAVREQYTAIRRIENLQGVAGTAVCSGEMDDHLTMAYLTVAFAPSRHGDPLIAAEGLYRTQVNQGGPALGGAGDFDADLPGVAGRLTSPGRLVLAMDLPAGPAVTVLTRQVVTARPSERDPDGLRVPIGMAQVFIPAPDRPYVVVLTLMTPTPDDFDDYARAMAAMACTVRFDDPALDEVQA